MMLEVKNIVVIFAVLCCTLAFPQEIKKCKVDDEKCMLERANTFLKNRAVTSQLGLSEIDPLFIKHMDISQGGNASVTIDLKFRNVDLVGLGNSKVYKITGFKEDPEKNKLEIKFKTPLATIIGPYQINGRMLVLPIQGKGNITFNLENLDVSLKYLTKKVEKDGKTYMHIDRSKFNYEVTGANINFTNLFNGDKALGDNMNLFLNQNWHILLDELKKPITTSFSEVFKNLFNGMFETIPYDELFEK